METAITNNYLNPKYPIISASMMKMTTSDYVQYDEVDSD